MLLKKSKSKIILLSTIALLTLGACSSKTSSTTTSTSNQTSTTSKTKSSATSSDYFTTKDLDASYDKSSAAKITLSDSSAKVSGDGVSTSDSTVTISKAGTYIVSGTSKNVQIKVTAADSDEVQIVLDNVTMENSDAAIAVEKAAKVYITLADGSKNTISDSSNHSDSDMDAAIFSKSDLTFNGNGNLTLNGNYKHGVEGNDSIHITGGTYTINAKKHGINTNDSLNITNAKLNIVSDEDGLHSDNDEDTSQGNIYLEKSELEIAAGDDGVHASNALVVASGTITVSKSNEGLEGKSIHIIDGKVTVTATDDGLNAADPSASASEGGPGQSVSEDTDILITIDGGTINVTAEGDGIDSNGNIVMNGGELYVSGSANDGNAPFDYDGTATLTGGKAVIVGPSGMAQGFSSSSTQASVMSTSVSGKKGSKVTITDSSGKEIASYTANIAFTSVLATSANIKEGETYTITVDGESTTETASLQTGNSGMGGGPGGVPGDGGPGGNGPGNR